MPQAIPFILAAVSIAGATESGIQLSQSMGQHSPEFYQKQALQQQLAAKDASKAADAKATIANIASGLPSLQAETGGATTPEYNASVVGTEIGAPGNQNLLMSAVNKWLGLGGPTDAASSGTGSPTSTGGSGGTGSGGFFPHAAIPDFPMFGETGMSSQQLQGGNA